jgi:uncharacterized damage-inducible protein DinB/glutaredoxin
MKEFLQKAGVPFEAINVEDHPDVAETLRALGYTVPAVRFGDQIVPGLDLATIAKLIGLDYTPLKILPPEELARRSGVITETVCATLLQLSDEQLQNHPPDRNRTHAELVGHIASIMRAFLDVYNGEEYNHALEAPAVPLPSAAGLIALAEETQGMFEEWWKRFGFDDPLDRQVQTYWGVRSLHEVLERCVWQAAQHTRQLTYFVEQMGVEPVRRLTSADLTGLPLPDGIHSGGEDV